MQEKELWTLEGQAADLAQWAYVWRRDRTVQEKPEADFVPRRIRRQDEIYRTLLPELGPDADSICYPHQHDTMVPQLPKAKGELLTGAIWGGGICDYEIELEWPDEKTMPQEADVEVRVYPTAWGWFGFSVDKMLSCQKKEGSRWTYPCLKDDTMDYAYNKRARAATEVLAVFAPEGCPVPQIHLRGESIGCWKKLTFTLEWGFVPGLAAFDGKIETFLSHAQIEEMDRENHKAKISCLYCSEARYGIDSKLTCVTDEEEMLGATVLLRRLAEEPICVPEAGLFFCPESLSMTAEEYMLLQKKQGKKTVQERNREHDEAQDWEELMRKIRLWRCPDGTGMPEFPKAPAANVELHVPDKRWETMYDLAVEQLRGPHMWGMLAAEVARSTLASEMLGLKAEADRIYDYFLASPGIKADGDFTTAEGSLEWAKTMRHDMGYAHEGTHFSTGKLLYSMMYRYYLTGDRAWLNERLPRLKKAADWIIRERRNYMADTPNREKLHCFGLMPPSMLGDYALPASDWRWYYTDNAHSQQGLSLFADVLSLVSDPDAAYYTQEAKAFEQDLLAAVKREALYAPVRCASDGMSRSFIPRMAYAGGLLYYGEETNVPQYNLGILDLFQAALPLGDIGGVMDPLDRRMAGTLCAMEERGLQLADEEMEKVEHLTATAEEKEENQRREAQNAQMQRSAKAPEESWFWSRFADLPKISHNANVYLRQDDIPNFLHFFFNHAIAMVGTNGKLWEHAHPDVYEECDNPDNGTAAWFTENFRNMLLTEDRGVLWLMKGTPRAWLKQGAEIEAKQAPTMYGDLTYKMVSDVENGCIRLSVQTPERRMPRAMKVRLRHPEKAKIQKVWVNGQAWKNVDADGETISFEKPSGKLEILVQY